MRCLTDYVDIKSQRLIILQALLDRGMTKRELSKQIGITEGNLGRFLAGHTDLWDVNKKKIENVLDIKLFDEPNQQSEYFTYYRVKENLTKAQLGEKSGVSASSISAYELEGAVPIPKNIIAISKALNVSIEALAYGPEWRTSMKKWFIKQFKIAKKDGYSLQDDEQIDELAKLFSEVLEKDMSNND